MLPSAYGFLIIGATTGAALSGDFTRNQDRFELPIMGKKQSWDNAWDVFAMSNYNTITSIAQSPQDADLLYIGTDDGLIQVSEDYGKSWRKIELGNIKGIPALPYVNDIKADLFDANTVYVALGNHKYGDYKPYLLKSTDRGKSWTALHTDLPQPNLVWRLVQDHVKKDLLFIGTEFGIYFSPNGGKKWIQLKGGLPTISFRDLTIQRRENDLVCASFGRSFYVFDDMQVFREVSKEVMEQEATLFPTRKAWWYIPRSHLGFEGKKGDQGAGYYVADNPPFGAVFTYYLSKGLKTPTEIRKEAEKQQQGDIAFPGWEALAEEQKADSPQVILLVRDQEGKVVRRLSAPTEKGFHRIAWDLRYPAPHAVAMQEPPPPMWGGPPQGMLVAPGTYTASLYKLQNGQLQELSGPVSVEVVPLREGALKGASPEEAAAFWRQYEQAVRTHSALQMALGNAKTQAERMKKVLENTPVQGEFASQLHQLRKQLLDLDQELNGNPARLQPGEKTRPTAGGRLSSLELGIGRSTYGPTSQHRKALQIINKQLETAAGQLSEYRKQLSRLAEALLEAGGPWMEGEALPGQ
jgi:photosystem II stability/assembly factor-like uncharacterized protein